MVETIHLQLLLATFAAWVGRMQANIIAYLIEENRILREQLQASGKRIRLTDNQRRRLAAKAKVLGRKTLNEVATIVTPDTLLAWHRRLIVADAIPSHVLQVIEKGEYDWANEVPERQVRGLLVNSIRDAAICSVGARELLQAPTSGYNLAG